jgi:hypothetical protein
LGVSNFRTVPGCCLDCGFQDGVHEILNGFNHPKYSTISKRVQFGRF